MYKKKAIAGILLMGGSGQRFESSKPKQFHRLAGKSLYLHTLEIFIQSGFFDKIVLICHRDWIEKVILETKRYKNVFVIQGGNTRQESSYLGLKFLDSSIDYVLIHDAVRPFVTRQILEDNLQKVLENKAVDTCINSSDTIVHAKTNECITDIPIRSQYLRGQTPQTFSYSLILKAHIQAIEKKLTDISDDCKLVLKQGHKVAIVQGSDKNIKITSQFDLIIADHILQKKTLFIKEESSCLKNKKFLLVGATGGIGGAVYEKLLEKKAKVICLSKSLAFNLQDKKNIQKIIEKLNQTEGPFDGLINCAGLLKVKPLSKLSIDEIEELLAVNLTGLIYCCKWTSIKPNGHIVNISSSSYSMGRKNYAIYSSAKAAVVNFTQALSEERPDLFINTLIPERTHTKMRVKHFPQEDPASLLKPNKIADTVIKLLQSSSTTGSIIPIKKDIST